jgi:putative membrane protein
VERRSRRFNRFRDAWEEEMKAFALSAAVLLGASVAVGAYAQSNAPRQTQSQTQQKPKKMSDAAFVQTAAGGDMFEIQAAKVALDKTKSDSVKSFAQMMIDDHTASTEKLKAAVEKSKVKASIPKTLDKKHSDIVDKLKKASASSFDQTYLQSQTAAHREMLGLLKNYSQSGDNEALKQFAAEASTVVEKHLSELQQMAQGKGGTRMPGNATGGSSPSGNMGTGGRPNR